MIEEGVIKFQCEWVKKAPPLWEEIRGIEGWRRELYERGLIGVYPNGIAFGNVSGRACRHEGFIISGTQTGGRRRLGVEHYTRVTQYDFGRNTIVCEGPVKASSESLTHAMVYEMDRSIEAVIHVHSRALWRRLMHKVPTTAKHVSYGTPEMAGEVERLYRAGRLRAKRIFVMGGHEEGIVSFGSDPDEAGMVLLHHLEN